MSDEHDDELIERQLLASAYLDGEVTAQERSRAESDPAVLAEVEVLRSVRQRLAGVDATADADADRRDAVIAAALAAAPPAIQRPPTPSLDARRRARWLTPVAAAAAALVIVVGGVVVTRNSGSNDDSASLSATTALGARTAADEEDAAGGDAAETTSAADQATTAPGAATTAAAAETIPEATTAEATEGTEASAAPTGEPSVVRSTDDLVALDTLQEFDGPPPDARAPTCALGRFVTFAIYQPTDEAVPVSIEVFALETTGELIAADPGTCEVLLRVAP